MTGSANTPLALGDALSLASPPVPLDTALRVAREHYGIVGTALRLTGERDQNFLVQADGGQGYLLKLSHPAEDRAFTDFQTQALLHIARADPTLPVPQVIRARDGRVELLLALDDGPPRIVRLLSYLQGDLLPKAPRSSAQRRHLAATLARLARALQGFVHPAAAHDLLWDLKHAARLRPLLVHMPDGRRRALAEQALADHAEHVEPHLRGLRSQVVHNDLNDYNVLVDPANPDRVVGILDFGDMVHTALINDLAIAASYQLADSTDVLGAALEFVAAYHAVLPLQPQEVDLLFDLMKMRLVTVVAISGWRAAQHPHNRDYILRNNALSWARLVRCSGLRRTQAQRLLRRACHLE